jgi:hypothetical protein
MMGYWVSDGLDSRIQSGCDRTVTLPMGPSSNSEVITYGKGGIKVGSGRQHMHSKGASEPM